MTDRRLLRTLKGALDESNHLERELLHWLEVFGRIIIEPHDGGPVGSRELNPRWKAIAKTHFEEGFMAFNRAVCGGGRTGK